jgi:hypothetical protein
MRDQEKSEGLAKTLALPLELLSNRPLVERDSTLTLFHYLADSLSTDSFVPDSPRRVLKGRVGRVSAARVARINLAGTPWRPGFVSLGGTMTRSKAPLGLRLLIEKLESRLQPGSMITGQPYGWSLLAGNLSILDQGSLETPGLVSQASFESNKPAQNGLPNRGSAGHLDVAVVPVLIARNEISSVPTSATVDDLTSDLANADLSSPAQTGPSSSVPLAAVAAAIPQMPAPATPVGSVAQSPTGVSAPAMPAASNMANAPSLSTPVSSASAELRAEPAHINALDRPTGHAIAGLQPRTDLHVARLTSGHDTFNPFVTGGNQATVNFLSYLGGGAFPSGGAGPDSINSVVVQQENGTNFIYLAGSITDSTGRTDAFAAKLTGDASSVVWISPITQNTAGPDTGTGIAVNSTSVLLVGNLADPRATPQTDGFIAQLDPSTGALGPTASVTGATLAAVTTDSMGNIYLAGSVPDNTNNGQTDVAFMQVSSDLVTTNYASAFSFTLQVGMVANSAVTTGSGLAVDNSGNAYFAGTIGVAGDPNNETFPLYGRLNATGTQLDWFVSFLNVTPGPGGIGTAVVLDQSGNVVVTGSLNDNGSSNASMDPQGNPTLLNQDLLLARIAQAPDASGNANVIDSTLWFVDDRSGNPTRVGDWTGNGIVALADGSTIVTGSAYDPAAGMGDHTSVPSKGIDVQVTHFGADDGSTTQNGDGDPENLLGGTGTDVGNALAVDPTTSHSPYKVYVVGSSNSIDLPTTAGVVQQSYSGTNATGFVGQVSVT